MKLDYNYQEAARESEENRAYGRCSQSDYHMTFGGHIVCCKKARFTEGSSVGIWPRVLIIILGFHMKLLKFKLQNY